MNHKPLFIFVFRINVQNFNSVTSQTQVQFEMSGCTPTKKILQDLTTILNSIAYFMDLKPGYNIYPTIYRS